MLYYFSVIIKGDKYLPKYGEYSISKNYSISEVLDIINSGNSIHRKITLPEGLTTKEILDVVLKRYDRGQCKRVWHWALETDFDQMRPCICHQDK